MEQTHLELTYWFLAAYLMATVTPGISARQFARQMGLSYGTAYMLLMKLRAGLVNFFFAQSLKVLLKSMKGISEAKKKENAGAGPPAKLLLSKHTVTGMT